jgi:hypothetical protein
MGGLIVAVLVGVHGIGKQHLGPHQLEELWRPALSDGLFHATGRHVPPLDLRIAFYGDLFRVRPASGRKSGVGDEDVLADLDAEEIADLSDAVTEIVPPADLAAAAEAPPKAHTRVPRGVAVLLGAVERRFPGASGVLVLGTLRQVRRYLRDPALKAEVDGRVAEWAAGTDVLIAHSLGSVVAYEHLRRTGRAVELLLTMGSPLGLRMVRSHLQVQELVGVPWVNVWDRADPVACAGGLSAWWPQVADEAVQNSSDAHAADQYLCRAETGRAIHRARPDLVP